MANQGWIKIDKKLVQRWNGTKKLMWWIDLLMMASCIHKDVSHKGTNISLKKNQCITSANALSKQWGTSKRAALNFLCELQQLGLIKKAETGHKIGSVITILSFTSAEVSANDTANDTAEVSANDTETQAVTTQPVSAEVSAEVSANDTAINKKNKKEKDKNKFLSKKKKFSPPLQEEVVDYFTDIGSTAETAAQFFDHFTSNGWLVSGRTAMKDWKAAARNWIRNAHIFAQQHANRNLHTPAASPDDTKREFAETAARVAQRFMRGEG